MKQLFYSFLFALTAFGAYAQNIQCAKFSNEFQAFIDSLKAQNYNSVSINGDLTLKTPGSNSLKFENLKGFRAKCRKEIKDGMYVRFEAYEICFADASSAKSCEAKIAKIIDGSDLLNEKIYDFIIRIDNRLIYIATDARIFYESVADIAKKLKKI